MSSPRNFEQPGKANFLLFFFQVRNDLFIPVLNKVLQ